jgi:HSP20 family protein
LFFKYQDSLVISQRKEIPMPELKEAPKAKTGDGQGQTKAVATQAKTAPAKTNGNPFNFMRRFAEEMDQLFDEFGLQTGWHVPRFLTRGHELLRRETGIVPAQWSPTVDVVQRDGQYVVRADLPGLSKDDIKVDINDDMITIQGERKQEKKEEREGYRYSECSYGSFYRVIPLPEGADPSRATAQFRDGVLEITLPASPPSEKKTRRLEVHQGK